MHAITVAATTPKSRELALKVPKPIDADVHAVYGTTTNYAATNYATTFFKKSTLTGLITHLYTNNKQNWPSKW